MEITWTTESFAAIDWDALAAAAANETCRAYAKVISGEIETETDELRKAAKLLVRDLLRLQLVFASPTGDWLQPASTLSTMPREALRALASDTSRVKSADVRARLADAAWLHGRATNYQVAAAGVQDYLASARQLYASASWPESSLRLQRAVQLARSLGPRQQLFTDVVSAAVGMLRTAVPTDKSRYSLRIIDLLYDLKLGDAEELAGLAELVATQVASNNTYLARDYLERAARCWLRAEHPARAASCMIEIAATLERDAEAFDSTSQGRFLCAHALEQALEAHRSIGGDIAGREIERLRARIQNVRASGVAALPRVEMGTFQIGDLVEHARRSVRSKTSFKALIGLCTLTHPTSVETLREHAKEATSGSLFSLVATSQRLGRSGRVIEHIAGADDDERLIQQMHAEVTTHHKLFAIGGIRPALQQIQLEHGLREADMFYLATRSPFVPSGREHQFAKGLAAGLFEDFDTAAHILMPQFENALRWHLARLGVPTMSSPASGGAQNEFDLGKVLEHPRLLEVFDSATIFDWRSLLTEKAGMNLRNELAHGLLDSEGSEQEFIYFWWCVLRVVVLPLAVAKATE